MAQPVTRPEVTRPHSGQWLLPAGAAVLTVAMRLWFVLEMRSQPFSAFSRYFVDSWYYHRWALDVLGGDFWGKEVFFLRPLYPYLLAAIYRAFGVHILAVQLVQVAMAGISCLLLYDLCRRMFDRRAAALAAFGFAVAGILVFYSGALLYVEVTVLLSLLAVWLTVSPPSLGTRSEIPGRIAVITRALAGIVWGLAVICRPELLLVLALVGIWTLTDRHPERSEGSSVRAPSAPRRFLAMLRMTGRRTAGSPGLTVVVVAAVVVIAAVPIRNYVVVRDPVLFTAHSGLNFYYGNNPAADGTWQPTAELEKGGAFSHDRLKRTSRMIDGRQLSWSKASAYWFRKGLTFAVQHPGQYFRLLGRKLLLFPANCEVPNDYYPETARASSLALRLSFLNFGAVLALGLLGMYWAWPLRRKALPAYLFVAVYLVSSLAFYVLSRLRAPVIPFLLMFAGFGLGRLLVAAKARQYRTAVVGLGVATLAYVGSSLIPVNKAAYSAQAWVQAGNILLEQRKSAKAVEAFSRALAHQPGNAWARYSLVMALAGSSRAPEAEKEFAPLSDSAATQPGARLPAALAGARVAIARRDFGSAARLYRVAIAQDSTYAEARYLLGLVYVSLDSLAPASYWLEQALVLDPNHGAARSALQAVRSRLGR